MDLTEKFIADFNNLSEQRQNYVLDFIGFLIEKEQKELEELMDKIITEDEVALKALAGKEREELEQLINESITENLEAFKELAK